MQQIQFTNWVKKKNRKQKQKKQNTRKKRKDFS